MGWRGGKWGETETNKDFFVEELKFFGRRKVAPKGKFP
jgi:hypothetical protein